MEMFIPNFIHNMGEDIGKIQVLFRGKVPKVLMMNMFQRALRMKRWYNTESEELEDIPFALPEKNMQMVVEMRR